MSGKSYVGKYVCYGDEDGSFTWGRIKDEGWGNTASGEREVFILTDRMTCRVARNTEEFKSIKAICRRITSSGVGAFATGGTEIPVALPDYQRFGNCDKLPLRAEPESFEGDLAVRGATEVRGVVPKLEDEISIQPTKGLSIFEKSGSVVSSRDGHMMTFLFRRYGYDTSVPKSSLDLDTDIVDGSLSGFADLTDDELFLLAMKAKLQNTSRLNLGMRNILALEAGGDDIAQCAVSVWKKRHNMV
jgi:hypothetical protein